MVSVQIFNTAMFFADIGMDKTFPIVSECLLHFVMQPLEVGLRIIVITINTDDNCDDNNNNIYGPTPKQKATRKGEFCFQADTYRN